MKKSITLKQQKKDRAIPRDSPEYRIALSQLLKLEEIANNRLFNADEARLYDILCKSLSLVREAPLTQTSTLTQEIELDDKQLIDIAVNDVDLSSLVKEDLKVIKEDPDGIKKTGE